MCLSVTDEFEFERYCLPNQSEGRKSGRPGKYSNPRLSATSVPPVSPWYQLSEVVHHRDTEGTEVAQREDIEIRTRSSYETRFSLGRLLRLARHLDEEVMSA